MGCGASKSGLHHVDDSVHVMLKHDKKVQQRKGEPVHGYKKRVEHPLLRPKEVNTPPPSGSDATGTSAPASASPATGNGVIATEE